MNFIIGPALWASKAAILSLYLRLFAVQRWLRITSYTVLLTTFLFYLAYSLLAGVFCTPRPGKPWDAAVMRKCTSLTVLYLAQGAVGTAADIIIFVLPLPIIFRLHLAPRKKLGLAAVFLAGILWVLTNSAGPRARLTLLVPLVPVLYLCTIEPLFTLETLATGTLQMSMPRRKWKLPKV